ncbi:Cof-type HAD-IIB family hydrolase [Frisingicoccus sp.]|uniref:Cof-type HAD-IIB family hydrolase n=1 Tax=Frisingicoccus sp. TaxID=1918627 RepID=UPI003AB5448F
MKAIKLAAMDIDGTLIGKNKILTGRTRKALTAAAAQGIHLVVASGRALQALPKDLIGIPGMEYVITSNGSSIFRLSDRKRIYAQDMMPDQVQKLLAFYKNYDCPMEAFICGVPYTSREYFERPGYFGAGPASVEYVRTTRQPVEDMRTFVEEHKNEIEGINFILRDMELKAVMRRQLETFDGLYVTSSVPRYLEISHGSVCKQSALAWLVQKLGILPEEVAAFGDGENDLEMIQYAGLGVAMGNAVSLLKQAADLIAPACDEDGAARVMEQLAEKRHIS